MKQIVVAFKERNKIKYTNIIQLYWIELFYLTKNNWALAKSFYRFGPKKFKKYTECIVIASKEEIHNWSSTILDKKKMAKNTEFLFGPKRRNTQLEKNSHYIYRRIKRNAQLELHYFGQNLFYLAKNNRVPAKLLHIWQKEEIHSYNK